MTAMTAMPAVTAARTPGWKRLVDALDDGAWHTASELYRLGMIVHSRASEARAKGYEIQTSRAPEGQGAESYWYRLVKS